MKKFLTLFLLVALACGVASATQYVPVFQETFAGCKSTIIQGGYFSESLYFEPAEQGDNAGWTIANAYTSERAIKFSAKTKTGTATTPAIPFAAEMAHNVKVTFRAQTWKGDNVDVHVQFVGVDGTEQIIDTDASTNISNRSEAPFELFFSDIPSGSKIKFSATAKEGGNNVTRFFLSDLVVYEEVEGTTPVLQPSTFYHHFDNLMIGHESETRTIDVNAENLASDIELTLPEPSNFAFEKDAAWDARKGGRLNVRFTGLNAGSKDETLIVKSGDMEQKVILTGNAKVYAPVVAAATNVGTDSFTATWEPTAGYDKTYLTVYTKENSTLKATELMFSKYIEGKSNNRALEIFNGTDDDISLLGYVLRMESNGAGGLTACEFKFPDAVIDAGGTYTICNAQFNAVRDIADKTIGYQDGGYANITTFTGDDAIGLFNPEGKLVDLLGYESYDTNDRVSGEWGTDVSYYRNADCYEPHEKFYVEEWTAYERDYCTDFGKHTMNAEGPVRKIVDTIEIEGNTNSYTVGGLTPGQTYYYAVQGLSNGLKTHYSKEASVVLNTSGIDAIDAAPAYSLSGNILTTSEGTEVYDTMGRPVPGNGTYSLAAGIYILRNATRAAKLIVR